MSPENLLESPQVIINHNIQGQAYYTLLMTDLDYPNPKTQSLEETCLWMITDIKAEEFGDRITIPLGIV
jgi:hypothetical protein